MQCSIVIYRKFSGVIVGVVCLMAILLVGTVRGTETYARSNVASSGGTADFVVQPSHPDPTDPRTRSYFIFKAHSGAFVQSSLRLINNGTAKGTARIYAVDAVTSQTTGMGFLSAGSVQRDAGAWITLKSGRVALNVHQSLDVPFQMTVPKDVRSGQHVGGIVMESVKPQTVQSNADRHSSFQIGIRQLMIIPVVVTVPGIQTEQLNFSSAAYDTGSQYQRILLGLRNAGNMILKPLGNIRISDSDGRVVQKQAIKMESFLPQDAIQYPIYIERKALKAGTYTVHLNLAYGHNHHLDEMAMFTIKPRLKSTSPILSMLVIPDAAGDSIFSVLSPWHYAAGGLFLLCIGGGLFFWVQKMFRFGSNLQKRRGVNTTGPDAKIPWLRR